MNIKNFQRILPLPRQMSIFEAKSDAVLKHLTFCDGAKGFVGKTDDREEEEKHVCVKKGLSNFFSFILGYCHFRP